MNKPVLLRWLLLLLLLSHELSDSVGDFEQLPRASLDAFLLLAREHLGREIVDAVVEAAPDDEGVERQELLRLNRDGNCPNKDKMATCFSSMYWTIFCRSFAGS